MAVLFLCTRNSCRSQMAEGIYRSRSGGAEVYSAGSRPATVHPAAIRVLREIGIDISGHRSKGTDAVPVDRVHLAVTVCDDASLCPMPAPGVRHVHWSIPDPAVATGSEEEVLEVFRRTRDDIGSRIEALLSGEAEPGGSA